MINNENVYTNLLFRLAYKRNDKVAVPPPTNITLYNLNSKLATIFFDF